MADTFKPDEKIALSKQFQSVAFDNLEDTGYFQRTYASRLIDAIEIDDILTIYNSDGKIAQVINMPVKVALADIVDFTHPNPRCVEFVQKYIMSNVKYKKWLDNILTSRWVGCSVSIVSPVRVDNVLAIEDIYTINPKLYIESNGIGQKDIAIEGRNGTVNVSRKNCIIHSFGSKFGDPYGVSMIENIKKAYDDKQEIKKAWKLYERRFGMPIMVGRLMPNATQEEVDTMKEALIDLGYAACTVFRGGVDQNGKVTEDIQIVETTKTTGDFESFMKLLDREILTSLGGASILFNTEENGSYSLGAIHLKIFKMTVDDIKNMIQDVFCGQIIQPLLLANFNELTTGSLIFKQFDSREFAEIAGAYVNLINGGALNANEPQIRKNLQLSLPTGTYDYSNVTPVSGGGNNAQDQTSSNSPSGKVDGQQGAGNQSDAGGSTKVGGGNQQTDTKTK